MKIIDPQTIDVTLLPSIDVFSHKQLPNISAIYFVIDSQDMVRYVGQTSSLRTRWLQEPRRSLYINGARIAWLPIEDASERRILERRLIRRFQPSHNYLGIARNTPTRSLSLQIPNDLYNTIDLLSDANGRSVLQETILLIQEAVIARQSLAACALTPA